MKKCLLPILFFSLAACGAGAERAAAEPAAMPAGDPAGAPSAGAQLVSVKKIWDAAPHQAFTSLIRYHDKWVCAFREASKHVVRPEDPVDARIRVLTSEDAETWTSVAELKDPRGDIRDAKLAILPDGRLTLLTCTNFMGPGAPRKGYQSIAFFTSDLTTWTPAHDVADPNMWLWGIKVHDGAAYSIGYACKGAGNRYLMLYKSADGMTYEPVTDKMVIPAPYPNENSIVFDDAGSGGGNATCLLRTDPDNTKEDVKAFLGTASAPYSNWTWKKLDTRVGGPALTRTPDGKLLGAGRLYEPKVHTGLFTIDPASLKVTEILPLPSGGDTSYPGLVWHDGLLYMSYYSSHEGKTSIYLAKVRLAPAAVSAGVSEKSSTP